MDDDIKIPERWFGWTRLINICHFEEPEDRCSNLVPGTNCHGHDAPSQWRAPYHRAGSGLEFSASQIGLAGALRNSASAVSTSMTLRTASAGGACNCNQSPLDIESAVPLKRGGMGDAQLRRAASQPFHTGLGLAGDTGQQRRRRLLVVGRKLEARFVVIARM